MRRAKSKQKSRLRPAAFGQRLAALRTIVNPDVDLAVPNPTN